MRRGIIFAHYDENSIIDDYVIYYLKELKKYSSFIIFVSDCKLSDIELQKLDGITDYRIAYKHEEYDFGSYRRGFEYSLNNNLLLNIEELIFANDSCYAPIYPLNDMFEKMSNKKLDFWGVTMNKNNFYSNSEHIQSYFIVFKRNVFMSECFKSFMYSITKLIHKDEIIKVYECGLTGSLEKAGFKWDVYCELSKKFQDTHILYFKELIKENKSPFLKRKIPALNSMFSEQIFNIKRFLSLNTNYNCIVEYPKYFTFGVVKYFIRKYILRRIY